MQWDRCTEALSEKKDMQKNKRRAAIEIYAWTVAVQAKQKCRWEIQARRVGWGGGGGRERLVGKTGWGGVAGSRGVYVGGGLGGGGGAVEGKFWCEKKIDW